MILSLFRFTILWSIFISLLHYSCTVFVKMVKYLNRESGYVQIEVMSHYFMRRRNRLFFIYSFKSSYSECLLTENRKTQITIKIIIKFMVLRYYYLNNINTCKMCKWLILDFRWQINIAVILTPKTINQFTMTSFILDGWKSRNLSYFSYLDNAINQPSITEFVPVKKITIFGLGYLKRIDRLSKK